MSSRLKMMLAYVCLALLAVSVSFAQDTNSRALVSGTPVSGTLDAQNLAQVYTLAATAGQIINLTVTTDSDARLGATINDASGAVISEGSAAQAKGAVNLLGISLPNSGTYYVTVLSASGIPAQGNITFQLTVDVVNNGGVTFTKPGQLLTSTGMQVKLTWNSTANLNLEVRDPVGGSLFFDTPTVPSGGRFGVNVNSVCNTATADSPTEQASWPAGVVPTGSYELLVYYDPLQDCPTSEPATFTLNMTVDGVALTPFQGTINPNQVFIASVVVNADRSTVPGLSGLRVDPPTTQGIQLTNASVLKPDVPAFGAITSKQPYQVYTFSGQANDVVSITLNARSGSLDTLLLVLDSNGSLVGSNDDVTQGKTDSAVTNLRLILGGIYTVIATRYGQTIGGTEGEYDLTLTGATASTDNSQTVTLPQFPNLPRGSVEVSLQWNTSADLQLLVRDPQGDTVFNDKPQISSGGTLASSGNVGCRNVSSTPVSYIYWPQGLLPSAGPYEIEVQYRNTCQDTRPVTFVLNVVANGQLILTATQILRPDERFVTSYSISLEGVVVAGEGGIIGTTKRPDSTSLDYASQLENARVINSGETVPGNIRLNQRFAVYVFDGRAGQKVTIGMEALNGTLDPVLFLIAPSNQQVAENDDAATDTRNALINGFTLPEDGRYIIIATHFGGRYGVTAGDYNLTLRLN